MAMAPFTTLSLTSTAHLHSHTYVPYIDGVIEVGDFSTIPTCVYSCPQNNDIILLINVGKLLFDSEKNIRSPV